MEEIVYTKKKVKRKQKRKSTKIKGKSSRKEKVDNTSKDDNGAKDVAKETGVKVSINDGKTNKDNTSQNHKNNSDDVAEDTNGTKDVAKETGVKVSINDGKTNKDNTSQNNKNNSDDVAKEIEEEESITGGKTNKDNVSQENKTKKNTDDAAKGDKEKETESKEKFDPPLRKPTTLEERKLVGKVVEMMIIAGMTNHVYRFNNKIRIQMNGGPIGLSLTGQVADCFMIDWEKRYMKRLEKYNLIPLLYTRFKDDILMAIKRIENGTKVKEGKLVIDETKKTDDEMKTGSRITFEILKEIAEEVDPMLKFTIDTPDMDTGIAVLDLKVQINKKENYRLDYEHYEKPTKHPKVILADSALSMNKKRTILTQECLRILRNTKIELGEDIRNGHLNRFMIKLKNSGYDKKFRIEIVDSATKAFENMIKEDRNGIKPLYRDRNWKSEERQAEKQTKKRNWFRNENSMYKTVLFVPPTPGSQLAKELQKRENELNKYNEERIKIVESGGVKIEELLTKKNPFKKGKCGEIACPLCKNKSADEKIEILCNTNNIGYRWTCQNCKNDDKKRVYEGESSRSARLRGKEHLQGYKNKNESNMLYKHKILEHTEEENIEFKMEITGLFKDALTRQANEAVRIKNCAKSEILNSKSQFNHPPITRIVVDRKNKHNKANSVQKIGPELGKSMK